MTDFKFGGSSPTLIVKDGTRSSREDNRIKRMEADAERRRRHQDTQARMSQQGVGADGSVARLGNRRMVTQDSPSLLLWYVKQQTHCKAEFTMVQTRDGGMESMIVMVCPKCVASGVPQGQAQLKIHKSHRNFDIDESKKGAERVHTGGGVEQIVMVHGKVTVHDVVRCSNTGCGWAARITDSIVTEV